MRPTLKHIALACALALAASSSQAITYLVDTGPGVTPDYSLYSDQSLAATFNVAAADTITGVDGWIKSYGPLGTVRVELIGGAAPTGAVLHMALIAVSGVGGAWQGVSGLNWAVAPGDYTLAFHSVDGFSVSMPGTAPNALATEWFTSGGQTNWNNFNGLDIGVRVAVGVVPEPGTWALMALGLAAVGGLARQRRA